MQDSPWLGPPETEIPGVVPVQPLVIAGASAVVALSDFRAFSTGLAFASFIWLAHGADPLADPTTPPEVPSLLRHGREDVPGQLRIGVTLHDGRETVNVDEKGPPRTDGVPFSRLVGLGGRMGSRSWRLEWWLPPYPLEATDVMFFVEWERLGVLRGEAEIKGDQLMLARDHVRPVWPS